MRYALDLPNMGPLADPRLLIELAREAIASGAARERLRQLVEFSNRAGEA